MSPGSNSKFVIYIHPSRGPITPVIIDLDPVMDAGDSNRGPDSTRAMATAVLAQLQQDKRLAEANVKASFEGIKLLVRHMNPAFSTYINGIALRVPGSIPGSDGGSAQDGTVREIQAQLDKLLAQRDEWHLKYQQEQRAHNDTTQQMEQLRQQSIYSGAGLAELSKLRRQSQDLETRIKTLDNDVRIKAARITTLEERVADETQERSAISVKLEAALARAASAERERDTVQSRLGPQVTELTRQRKDLDQQVTQHKQHIERLEHALAQVRGDAGGGRDGTRSTVIDY